MGLGGRVIEEMELQYHYPDKPTVWEFKSRTELDSKLN